MHEHFSKMEKTCTRWSFVEELVFQKVSSFDGNGKMEVNF
jgi:hypothetical protein